MRKCQNCNKCFHQRDENHKICHECWQKKIDDMRREGLTIPDDFFEYAKEYIPPKEEPIDGVAVLVANMPRVRHFNKDLGMMKCNYCGKEVHKESKVQKYCSSECQRAAMRERAQKKYQEKKAMKQKEKTAKKATKKTKQVDWQDMKLDDKVEYLLSKAQGFLNTGMELTDRKSKIDIIKQCVMHCQQAIYEMDGVK